MDCPSEGEQVRARLEGVAAGLEFDFPARLVRVWHDDAPEGICERIRGLGFGGRLLDTVATTGADGPAPDSGRQARVLWILLAINGVMFLVEGLAGWWADSAGLLADGLDMLADAGVYGVALYAVGRGARQRGLAARLAGWLQLALALGLLGGVVQRMLIGPEPLGGMMMGVALLALVANASCLWLLAPRRAEGAHMRASYIFSASDVIANLGVVVAGALVTLSGSPWPDHIIGLLIVGAILTGSVRILRLPAEEA